MCIKHQKKAISAKHAGELANLPLLNTTVGTGACVNKGNKIVNISSISQRI
jgi:hypothetical protein